MSLAQAIRLNAKPLAEAQNDYQTNVVAVNTLMISVLTSSLPSLNHYPADWATFVATLERANGAALGWSNNVMARLLEVPQEVQNYNTVITQVLQDAAHQASALVAQPTDKVALGLLNVDLQNLSVELSIVVAFISGAVTNIQKFTDDMPALAAELQSIAAMSAADSKADTQQLAQLQASIDTLQSDISSLTAAIVALSIADAIALTIGVVATIALWPVGALVWFVMGPAVAAATTFIALDAVQIKSDQAQIKAIQASMTGFTADVATLNTLANNYATMATQAQGIENSLQAILAAWQSLEADVNAAISDINAAGADTTSENFAAVVNDVNDAITEWNAAYKQAGTLVLDLNVNNAQLQLGMSSAEVQAALSAGESIGIIQYLNQLSH